MKLRIYKDPMYTVSKRISYKFVERWSTVLFDESIMEPLNTFSVRKITINCDWDTKILRNPFLREFHMNLLKVKVVP